MAKHRLKGFLDFFLKKPHGVMILHLHGPFPMEDLSHILINLNWVHKRLNKFWWCPECPTSWIQAKEITGNTGCSGRGLCCRPLGIVTPELWYSSTTLILYLLFPNPIVCTQLNYWFKILSCINKKLWWIFLYIQLLRKCTENIKTIAFSK